MALLLGADLALKHGAIVDISGRVLHRYIDRPWDTIEEVFQTARTAASATPAKSTVIIDFDRTQGSWGDNPTVGTMLTVISAFYAALVRTKRCHVCYCSPNLVRACLGLPAFCSKEDVHFACRGYIPQGLSDPEGDLIDAWLLALTFQCSKGVES